MFGPPLGRLHSWRPPTTSCTRKPSHNSWNISLYISSLLTACATPLSTCFSVEISDTKFKLSSSEGLLRKDAERRRVLMFEAEGRRFLTFGRTMLLLSVLKSNNGHYFHFFFNRFIGANFIRANFIRANSIGANFIRANFKGSSLCFQTPYSVIDKPHKYLFREKAKICLSGKTKFWRMQQKTWKK